MKTAFVFAGQGAQYEGMGKSLYDASPAARRLLDALENRRSGLMQTMFTGSKEELAQTKNTQPCVYAHALAAWAAALEIGIRPGMAAGFSLGEYAALACAGVFTPEAGLDIVCERAAMMQEGIPAEGGAMAAILKLTDAQVTTLCEGINGVWPVNFNCPQQVVIAGTKTAVAAASAKAAEMGGRAIPLAVGGPFHTPLMAGAAAKLEAYLGTQMLSTPAMPVYANVTAQPYPGETREIKALLARQAMSPVLWEKTVRSMADAGAEAFVELGPGKVLSGFIKRILPEAAVFNVDDAGSLETLQQALNLK
jgi:[acyl-carrier-protein] S-malonyltransferase